MMQYEVFYRVIRLLIVLFITITSITLLIIITPYAYPFIIAFILAFSLHPIIKFVESKLNCPRTLASFLVIIGTLFLLILFISISMIESIQAMIFLANYIPEYFQEFLHLMQNWIEAFIIPIYEKIMIQVEHLQSTHQTTILNQLNQTINHIAVVGGTFLENFFFKITTILRSLPNMISVFLFILLGTFFISKDWYKLEKGYKKKLPNTIQEGIQELYYQLKKALFGYLKAQLILTIITICVIFIGLSIIKVNYAFSIALLIGLVDFIPYLGTGLFFIPWTIYLYFTGNFDLTIQVSVLYMVIIIQRQLLEPKILATQIGVNPLFVLMTAFVSYQIIGVLGILLAPFFVIFLQALNQTEIFKRVWHYIYYGTD
ncbi:sporulation integral membrane protein YtvI [Paraliobacillus quinghaiensis]|uniref:Sporulation integral membrane protein YtvI n=1 Tax=Paraliobacillus quinghaiensis TaxID=470815 RepID=A0A917TLD4_9BACI|nr:sporulation integral membrane protein YtvI [Paraliobacillus quinghaiensis]GGM26676.1 sporulation integral membrane protein YtvI [Paraliobacillus quinghaiensis]